MTAALDLARLLIVASGCYLACILVDKETRRIQPAQR